MMGEKPFSALSILKGSRDARQGEPGEAESRAATGDSLKEKIENSQRFGKEKAKGLTKL